MDNEAEFRCRVSNVHGMDLSQPGILRVTTSAPPTGLILRPEPATLYTAGAPLFYLGVAKDAEQGNLPASAFTWQVDFHHDEHMHPFLPPTTGVVGGAVEIPNVGETSPNVFYRVHLTVKDAALLTHSSYRDVFPRTSTFTLATVPAGFRLTLDFNQFVTPTPFLSVVGMIRTLGVITPQVVGDKRYEFVSWSDGGAATHNIRISGVNTTYTATFRETQ